MIRADLYQELQRNDSDKKLLNEEASAYQKQWASYVLNNKDRICSNLHPIVVKKKRKVRWNEFINKIKKMFGFERRKEEYDGIETYLQYCNSDEQGV